MDLPEGSFKRKTRSQQYQTYTPSAGFQKAISAYYAEASAPKNSSPEGRVKARIRGVNANIELVKFYMPHINNANQARAYATIDNLLGTAEILAQELKSMTRPKKKKRILVA